MDLKAEFKKAFYPYMDGFRSNLTEPYKPLYCAFFFFVFFSFAV